jgi:hypothetical protein
LGADADLEIGLRWDRRHDELYPYLRFDVPGNLDDNWRQLEEPIDLDFGKLAAAGPDNEKYAEALTEMILGREDVAQVYRTARDVAAQKSMTLHLRLHINGPPRYHALRWELLRDPDSGHRIAGQSGVLFSRYLSSEHWRPITPVPERTLRGLIAVANPTDPMGRFNLAPVEVGREVELACAALNSLSSKTVLANGRATLAAILGAIEDEEHPVDILYLVCHGRVVDGLPVIYLESPDGAVDPVDGSRLVERMQALDRRPAVVMLCSCQSAAGEADAWSDDAAQLSALGPKLAEAGVPAVVAMQGNVSMKTVNIFAPTFFAELAKDGIVDRAMSVARRAVLEREDWWMPVLFSRLRSGRTYYTPQFAKGSDDAWEALRLQIRTGDFVPVLGPGLADSIIGSRDDIARSFVERWQMPLAPHSRRDLAQVGQYLHVRYARGAVRSQLTEHLRNVISKRRDEAEEGDVWSNLPETESPLDAFLEVGRRMRKADEGDPYRVAAALPVSLYVTTAWTDLLQDALRERGREPVTRSFAWIGHNSTDSTAASVVDHSPTPQQPLVYHLFGRLADPPTLVVSEDDYFQWFVAWLNRRDPIPSAVQKGLTWSPLLFLGFRLDDWDFRVLFQSLRSFGGSAQWRENKHTGVQVSPESQVIDPQAAQEYLEQYFGENVHIFWGETRQFLDELRTETGLQT